MCKILLIIRNEKYKMPKFWKKNSLKKYDLNISNIMIL